jgi:hypothetical protein
VPPVVKNPDFSLYVYNTVERINLIFQVYMEGRTPVKEITSGYMGRKGKTLAVNCSRLYLSSENHSSKDYADLICINVSASVTESSLIRHNSFPFAYDG